MSELHSNQAFIHSLIFDPIVDDKIIKTKGGFGEKKKKKQVTQNMLNFMNICKLCITIYFISV